ncbi:WbqC family protein [Marinitoga aeolica]|uniref:WbqC family protein n=1 Tax=Marinitoga aeolica TaxID=2809031 RepID=A0ABY8PSZ1_9BACT|nr:WbqC family protein [Marinitoga aeolica]WGS65725.1 WbqC family protein [Marinitoga aeolica]
MKVAILQPNYLPWKGVFDMINLVDVFVFLDDVQYTKNDWRNRNKIKTPKGTQWITVPVKSNSIKQKIFEVEVSDKINWQKKHHYSFLANYAKAKYFKEFEFLIEDFYIKNQWKNLNELNIYTTKRISEILKINTKFIRSSELNIATQDKNQRLIDIIKYFNGKIYISGPAAKNYIDMKKFKQNNIEIYFMNYNYPEYHQLHGNFVHNVTVLDVIFNCGENASKYIFQNNI